jgi:phosphoribosyl-ATP pyrophosphohydrolase
MSNIEPLTFETFESLVIPQKREPTELGYHGMLLYQSNGMNGEAGEVGNEVKKLVRDRRKDDSWDKIVGECGDTLFYMQRLLRMNSLGVEDAARALMYKLDVMRREREARRTD